MLAATSPTNFVFSIIIPTRNRPTRLASCLEAITALDYPAGGFEVIVVDDGSHSSLQPVSASFMERLTLTHLWQEQKGPGAARNRAAATARGRFLAFIDDDCAVDRNWLRALEAHLTNRPDELVGGKVVNALITNIYSVTAQTILDAVYAYYNPAASGARFFGSCNFALTREKFDSIGGFIDPWPVVAAEDRVFCYKWRQRGWKMSYATDAVVRHSHELNLNSFWEMYFRYGRGAYLYHQIRDQSGDLVDQVVPSTMFYQECLRRAGDGKNVWRTVRILGLLAIWQLANTAGYFAEKFRLGR